MPHNLVTLCLCYANQTSSEVPISSSNRDTARLGRGDRILLPSVIPAQVQGRHNTTRSSLTIGYLFRRQRRQMRCRTRRGYHPFGRSVRRPDAARNLELANAEFRTTADADQVPGSVWKAEEETSQKPGAVTRIGSCSLE